MVAVGFGLQTAENYVSTDTEIVSLRTQYVADIAKMLALSGKNPQDSQAAANT